MANSFVELPVSGSDTYTFPFPYLDSAHISVFVGGVLQTVDTHYTYTSSNVIEFTAGNVPTDTSQVIRITRSTAPTGRLVGFSNTGLDADDLNLDSDQIFYMAQEAVDTVETSVFRGVDGTLDVNGRLTNVADPIDNLDAVNRQYVASQVAAGSGSVTVDAVAPSSPSQGDLWIDTSSNVMYVWTGTQWVNGGIQESARYDFLGSDGFPVSTRLLFGGSLYGSNLSAVSEVYLNGILLKPTTSILDFTTGDYDILDSTGLSISPAPSTSDEITVITSSALSSSLVTAINTVNTNSAGITTVASNITDVNDVAANMADVTGAVTQAQNAASSANTAFASAELSIQAKILSEQARDDAQTAKTEAETAQAAAEAAESSINTGLSGKADLSGATFTGDVYLENDMRLRFKEADGTSGLDIYTATDGTVWINEGGDANFNISGDDLRVRSDDLTLRNRNGDHNYFKGVDEGAVQVYHGDGTERIETTATGIDVNGTVTADGLSLGDSQKAQFGAGNDLQIYHDGNNSVIDDAGTGNLFIRASRINLQNLDANPNELMASFIGDGSAQLYYDNSIKLETTDLGITVTGTVTADGLTMLDSEKITLGTGGDLEIYHNGSNSVIEENGTGNLFIKGTDLVLEDTSGNKFFKGTEGGAVQIWYNQASHADAKLSTTATGIDVTGTVTADGVVTAVNTFNQSTVSSIDTLSIPSGSTLVMTGGSASGGISTDNGAGSYPVGYSMTIINQSTDDKLVNQTGSDVLTLCGQAGVSTGNLTLGSGGVASLIKTAANAWTIFGSNLS